MDCHSACSRTASLQGPRCSVGAHATPSDMSQSRKDKSCVLPFTWELSRLAGSTDRKPGVAARPGGRAEPRVTLMAPEFLGDEKRRELDGGDGCTTAQTCWATERYAEK